MGDKTRMERLSQLKNVFVRPSPSGGNLGGVARKTRESIIACEAAGFDVIIIETIGAGQSEVAARSMVDFFMLLLLPGEGDELQGLKKGTVELSDAIIINKADGDNVFKAQSTLVSYKTAVHYLLPATEGWETCVLTASALNDNGIDDIWQKILEFEEITKQSGVFQERRRSQAIEWVHAIINDSLKTQFYSNAKVKNIIPSIEEKVSNGTMNSAEAAQILLQAYEGKILPD
jgi:LAO/AO transport system kinase